MSMSRHLKRLPRLLARPPVWLIAGLCLASWIPLGHAARADCGPLLERTRFEPNPPANGAEILEAQHCLEQKGFPPVKIDGKLGPLTRSALEAYWKSLAVVAAAPSRDGLGVAYKLTQDDLKVLQVGKGIMEQMKKLKDQPFASEEAFRQALTTGLKEAGARVDLYLPLVLARGEKKITYSLSEEAFNQLRIQNLRDEILAKLVEMKDLGYPSRAEIDRAIKLKIGKKPSSTPDQTAVEEVTAEPVSASSAELRQVRDQVKEVTAYLLTEPSLAALAEDPRIGKDIVSMVKSLPDLLDIEYPSARLFRSALLDKAHSSHPEGQSMPSEALEPIVRQARKVHGFDAASRIVWNGKGCGCVLDTLSGTTYGFFPYWRAGSEQTVNFSVLSRIGYFAVSLDNDGKLADRFHWRADKADFINEARKHGTKVDLVIYKNDWEKWRADIAAKDYSGIDTATSHIVEAVREKLDNSFFNRHKAIFSLGASETPPMGDGVTLFFDGYPRDDEASDYLLRFVRELRKKLRAAGQHYFLNMVVPPEAIGEGFYTFKYLSLIIPDVASNSPGYEANNDVDLFLVLMEEPTTQSKKALRQRIENRFTGSKLYRAIQRRNLLRKIVPVLMPDASDARQYAEDVIYLEDNFGGVGLWPMPAIKGDGKDKLAKVTNTVAETEIASLTEFYQVDGAASPSALRTLVCPNKWTFRIAFDVLTFLLMGFGVLAIFLCALRKFWARYAWYFLALVLLWVGLALAILFFDPFYTALARGNGPLILLVLANLLYVAFVIINRKRSARQP